MTVITKKQTEPLLAPLTPRLGVVVNGVDAKLPLDDEIVSTLKDALLKYKVIFLRDQNLDPRQQAVLASYFGDPYVVKTGRFNQDYEEGGLSNLNGVVAHFHADHMYGEEGPAFTMLQMLELPAVGGDTMWADLVTSYDELSQPLKDLLETLRVSHVMPHYYLSDEQLQATHKRQYQEDLTPEQTRELRDLMRPNEHPLVRVIPETGVKNYWVSEQHTKQILGLDKEESDAMLGLLFRHQLKPKYVMRWNWSVGDIAIWDNRTTLHCGIYDYGSPSQSTLPGIDASPEKRRGRKASIQANTPVPA